MFPWGPILFSLTALSVLLFRSFPTDPSFLLMHLFHTDYPSGGKDLSFFIESISSQWNTDFTRNNCSDCSCSFSIDNDLEPLIHCILNRSNFTISSKKNATFVFVPIYSNTLRSAGVPSDVARIVGEDDSFKRWKGSRHIVVDAFVGMDSLPDYLRHSDQHLVIGTNMTIEFVRSNRWFNSRHVLVPPLQKVGDYPFREKRRNIVCFGGNGTLREFASERGLFLIDNVSNWSSVVEEIAVSNFTILYADKEFPPFLIYEIIRARSIPVLISGPFLAASANTYINYSRISIRAENLSSAFQRIRTFDLDGIENELTQSAKYLMWPLDGIATADNAAGVLLDALNTRHRVIRPILRRTFIGSDEYIP
jgi:hypothetical protein